MSRWVAWPDGQTRIGYGADYNPEQWGPDVWREDVALMREAGVSIVSLGIFAWARLEPVDGSYDFSLFDQVMDLLHENGVAVCLATATASPPAWLAQKHPELLPVDADGRVMGFGGRQSWCPSSRTFTSYATRLVRRLAEHYRSHPALVAWHVSNEYGCHNSRCYCEVSAVEFRRWLQKRYGDIARLNQAWATDFWSQRYSSFDQIEPPRLAPTFCNPTQQLDYARFCSDELLGQYFAERDVLHEVTPDIPVTTNFMSNLGTKNMDYLRWGPEQDFVSTDHYLAEWHAETEAELAFGADLTRGCSGGAPWMLMEQSTSAVNWGRVNRPKVPGEMWRNTLAQVARGADSISYFQWRASAGGAEKFHSAMVPHAGPDSRVFREVVEQGRRLAKLTELVGSRSDNKVALLFDYPSWWASEQDSHPRQDFSYRDTALAWYLPLWRQNVGVDVIGVEADLSPYDLVVVPALYLTSDATADAIRAAAERGATVLVTYFSGLVDDDDRIRLGGYPGAFRDLLGVRVEEFIPLRAGSTVALSDGSTVSRWAEDLSVTDATAVLSYVGGPLDGKPAVTVREAGAGRAWYVSAELPPAAIATLMGRILSEAGIAAPATWEGELEIVRRGQHLVAINHSEAPATLYVTGHELLTGESATASREIPAGETAVVRLSRSDESRRPCGPRPLVSQ